eukprot:jgi/Ulvmu1/617/UM001_0625.1
MALTGTLIRCRPRPFGLHQGRGVVARSSLANIDGYLWEDVPPPKLQNAGRRLVEEVRIRAHEVGPNQQSNIVTISNILQEAASNHIVSLRGRSEKFFAADPELAKLDLIFVLTRMQIRMHRFPRWGEIVRVETYFQSEGRVGARRDWVLTDVATGACLGCATSSWVMFNYKTRRLGRMPPDAREAYEALMPDPPEHCITKNETRLKLPDVTGNVQRAKHTASPVYMDMNKHLNNAAYLTWILDSIPDEVLSGRVLAQYEVDYKAEGVAGDEILVGSQEVAEVCAYEGLDSDAGPRQFVTVITKSDNGESTELIRARTTWV